MVVVPVLSFIVSIIVAVVSISPSFGPLTVNGVDGTVVDDSLDAATLKFDRCFSGYFGSSRVNQFTKNKFVFFFLQIQNENSPVN